MRAVPQSAGAPSPRRGDRRKPRAKSGPAPTAGPLASAPWLRSCMIGRSDAQSSTVRLMNYQAYQAQADMIAPWRMAAKTALAILAPLQPAMPEGIALRGVAAGCELIARAALSHERPPYGIASVMLDHRAVEVSEEVAHATPFGSLLH